MMEPGPTGSQCQVGVIRSTRDYIRGVAEVSPGTSSSESETALSPVSTGDGETASTSTTRDNPREIRNKAEKLRRDKLNQSIAQLASLVPPVVCSTKKIDKTSVLRYTAHYLRAHQYVFNPPAESAPQFSQSSTQAILSLLNGFLLTITYKGLIVVVSQNINEYLGYNELELLGKSIFNLVHVDDRELLRDQLVPRSQPLGNHGELLVPDDEEGRQEISRVLANEKRRYIIRFLKLSQRSEPRIYVTCHIEGSFRISDHVMQGNNRSCQMVRRARARGDNPCSSGNDVVFIGVVRPCTETFFNESALESYRMEYRTRHSIDGEIIQCEQRIALVTGYMMSEVSGVNAMNFIHRDEVRWVVIALQEMYTKCQLFGESCYRLMTKNGLFIYMRTRGRLDVNTYSRSVTSFVCTNTVVDEQEGKKLIRMMKERFTVQASYDELQTVVEDISEFQENDSEGVEDPRQLEKVILNMVTALPSADESESPGASPSGGGTPQKLALIPPKKERIVSAIEKIYSVIKTIPKQRTIEEQELLTTIHEDPSLIICNEESPQTPQEEITEAPPSCSGTSNLPPFNEFFIDQNGSESENSNFNYGSEFSHMDCVMTVTSHELTFTIDEVECKQMESKMMNECEGVMAKPLFKMEKTTAVKRSIDEEQEMMSKKKTVVETNAVNDQPSGHNTPTTETFYDDEALMGLIQSAMETMYETMESNFPDLLTSEELEEVLDEDHSESGKN